MVVEVSISLTEDEDAFVHSLVESGHYPSPGAVLRRGLDLLRRDHEARDAELHALRSLIEQRSAGEFISLEEAEVEARAMLERKRKTRAAT
ncbi:type II toxin-antitoxin system ParD family antitoxin [Siccirubricoccus phaeus]|uniref:type II toxin-antitoxin system ParD family antitoxin n=1 Tax=Siccirubricoccus phaeus TaxID=2595053 RepID=UPI0011F13685|nr:type II toxin-antitoxin system ParD family antitoxin [Siccirubricoccus phaeus]